MISSLLRCIHSNETQEGRWTLGSLLPVNSHQFILLVTTTSIPNNVKLCHTDQHLLPVEILLLPKNYNMACAKSLAIMEG